MEDHTAEALYEGLTSPQEEGTRGEPANVVDGLFEVSRAIRRGLSLLGNADASTSMGALEAHGKVIEEAGEHIRDGLFAVAEAVHEVAQALRDQQQGGPSQ